MRTIVRRSTIRQQKRVTFCIAYYLQQSLLAKTRLNSRQPQVIYHLYSSYHFTAIINSCLYYELRHPHPLHEGLTSGIHLSLDMLEHIHSVSRMFRLPFGAKAKKPARLKPCRQSLILLVLSRSSKFPISKNQRALYRTKGPGWLLQNFVRSNLNREISF